MEKWKLKVNGSVTLYMGFPTFPHPHPTKKDVFRNDLWSDHLENTLVKKLT